jgi:hypothetical protein
VSIRPLARRVVRMADSLSGCPGPLRYTSQMGMDRSSCAFASRIVVTRDSEVSIQERMRSGLRAEMSAAELSAESSARSDIGPMVRTVLPVIPSLSASEEGGDLIFLAQLFAAAAPR